MSGINVSEHNVKMAVHVESSSKLELGGFIQFLAAKSKIPANIYQRTSVTYNDMFLHEYLIHTCMSMSLKMMYKQVLFHARVTFLKKHSANQTKNSHLKTVYFLGVSGLTSSSNIVYDYTTSGHMDLQIVYVLYIQYTVYPFLYSIFIYF